MLGDGKCLRPGLGEFQGESFNETVDSCPFFAGAI